MVYSLVATAAGWADYSPVRRARRFRELTGTSEDQIDIYFGWQKKILLKAMQVHYASLSILDARALYALYPTSRRFTPVYSQE